MLDKKYYFKSISTINNILKSNLVFFVFSDDINYCKNIFKENKLKNNFIYIDNNKNNFAFRDMQLMSYCKHNILANSTFSWWASWLNKNPENITLISDLWAVESNFENGHILKKWIIIK